MTDHPVAGSDGHDPEWPPRGALPVDGGEIGLTVARAGSGLLGLAAGGSASMLPKFPWGSTSTCRMLHSWPMRTSVG